MPSPPPPYSPGQNTISQTMSPSPHLSGAAFPSHQSHPTSAQPHEYTPSPPSRPVSGYTSSRPTSMVVPSSATSVTSNHQFPPPPPANAKNRSASRDKLHSKFSLSSFRNRGSDIGPAPNAIDALRINTTEAISRIPGSPGLPPQRISQLCVTRIPTPNTS